MKTQLFTFLSFVLSFAVLGEVKVQKSPLKSLLIDNASVVTDVTGTDAAKRLEADGGKSWIDGDGRVYRVERRASFRGLSAFSADDPDSTVQWSFDYPGAEYCDLSYDPPSRWYLSYGRMEDVENDGVIWQEEVQYVYEGTAPWSASSVTMKREHYNDEFVLSLAFVTNAADRVATTGEVARIASGLGGGLTTNDVCSIVTNEVAVGDYRYSENGKVLDDVVIDWRIWGWEDSYGDVSVVRNGAVIFSYRFTFKADYDSARENGVGYVDSLIEYRVFPVTKNALGLAKAKDVVSASAITNIVRDNIGTVWDSSLGVAWQARMHNGHLYYIAVTNKQEVVK